WLTQMGWDASIIGPDVVAPTEAVIPAARRPALPDLGGAAIGVGELAAAPASWTIVDLSRSPAYKTGHIPAAHFVLASRFATDLTRLPGEGPIVLVSADGAEAAFALADARAATKRELRVLSGGTRAWTDAGHALDTERQSWISTPDDVYKRPYEGTDNATAAMQAYIDWELQLVAQLANDSVSNFHVV
ncbi:rhodanese-like domain-containing protein, partial [Bradyrhizobium sp.]